MADTTKLVKIPKNGRAPNYSLKGAIFVSGLLISLGFIIYQSFWSSWKYHIAQGGGTGILRFLSIVVPAVFFIIYVVFIVISLIRPGSRFDYITPLLEDPNKTTVV